MRRLQVKARSNWREETEKRGLIFDNPENPYWLEGYCYEFSSQEIDLLESVANDVHQLCLKAIDYIISRNLFHLFYLPEPAIRLIKKSWQQKEPYLYGRFDFAYDGYSAPKLLEYNADTPTSLLESSVIQWDWLQDIKPESDQFNSIHEALIERWQALSLQDVHFTCISNNAEDFITTEYLRDTAIQAGLETQFLDILDIGYHHGMKLFCDLQNIKITTLFKLYPWEWLVQEAFAQYLPVAKTKFFEPIWKMLLGNKAILPILWEIAPDHPNLLPAYYDQNSVGTSVRLVSKPILGREGQNIALLNHDKSYETSGIYGTTPKVYQEYFPLPIFDGKYPVCGLWMIGERCCGLSIRESITPITDSSSQFVPHFFS